MTQIERMNKCNNFLDMLAIYEDVSFEQFHSYNNIENKMGLAHRLARMENQIDFIKSVITNARNRVQNEIDKEKLDVLKTKTER